MNEQMEIEAEEPEESDSETETQEAPDMSSEMADDVGDFAAQIESEAAPSNESQEWDDEAFEIGDSEVSAGDIYCNLLTIMANTSCKTMGSGEAPFENSSGELDTTLAKQLELDTYFDQVMARRSKSELTPEQALVFSTLLFFGAVIGSDPKIIEGLSGKIRRQNNDG